MKYAIFNITETIETSNVKAHLACVHRIQDQPASSAMYEVILENTEASMITARFTANLEECDPGFSVCTHHENFHIIDGKLVIMEDGMALSQLPPKTFLQFRLLSERDIETSLIEDGVIKKLSQVAFFSDDPLKVTEMEFDLEADVPRNLTVRRVMFRRSEWYGRHQATLHFTLRPVKILDYHKGVEPFTLILHKRPENPLHYEAVFQSADGSEICERIVMESGLPLPNEVLGDYGFPENKWWWETAADGMYLYIDCL